MSLALKSFEDLATSNITLNDANIIAKKAPFEMIAFMYHNNKAFRELCLSNDSDILDNFHYRLRYENSRVHLVRFLGHNYDKYALNSEGVFDQKFHMKDYIKEMLMEVIESQKPYERTYTYNYLEMDMFLKKNKDYFLNVFNWHCSKSLAFEFLTEEVVTEKLKGIKRSSGYMSKRKQVITSGLRAGVLSDYIVDFVSVNLSSKVKTLLLREAQYQQSEMAEELSCYRNTGNKQIIENADKFLDKIEDLLIYCFPEMEQMSRLDFIDTFNLEKSGLLTSQLVHIQKNYQKENCIKRLDRRLAKA